MSLRDTVAARDLENQDDEFQVDTQIPPMDAPVPSDEEAASGLFISTHLPPPMLCYLLKAKTIIIQ